MIIVIPGKIPSKKNSRIITGNKRARSIPSNSYRVWHKRASIALFGINIQSFTRTSEVKIGIFLPDRRRRDLSNMAESVMDFLVDMDILSDDNFNVVPKLIIYLGGFDPSRPRAEVEILE